MNSNNAEAENCHCEFVTDALDFAVSRELIAHVLIKLFD
jgi:hypothetical protein